MPTESIEVSGFVPAQPDVVFQGFLSSEVHTQMTGGEAVIHSTEEGGTFQAWGGFIQGVHVTLEPNSRLIQRWRTGSFADSDEDSLLEISLHVVDGGTRVDIRHSNIPEGQGKDYQQGWHDRYLTPMHHYFSKQS